VIIEMGPKGDEIKLLTESEALAILKEVEQSEVKPYTDAVVATSLISKELKGSPVIKTQMLPELNATEWTLANNARVVYRFADFQKDNVLLNASSNGGTSLYPPDQLASANLFPQFISNFGVGNYDATTLKKMLTGKNVSLNPGISDLYETFSGSSSPKDFETMLQLLYLRFEQPRFDADAYQALKSRYLAMLASMNKNPEKVMSDSLQIILSNHSKRTVLMVPELFDKVSLEQMEKIYRDRFADAGDFTFFIVGNLDEATVKPLVEKYVGSLTDLPRTETWKDNNEGMPKGKTNREILIPLQTAKGTVYVVFNRKLNFTPKDNLLHKVVGDVLRLRYTEEIREKEGGTYGVSVTAQNERYPKSEKALLVNFDTDPAKVDHLKSIIYSEIDKIVKNGPTTEDLDKVVKNLLKDREQAKPNNSYWMNMLTSYYRYNLNLDNPGNYENILKSMTVKDVQKFVKKFFKKTDVVDLVFTPKK